jgi:type I restriction enzyme S subunit
VPLRSVAIDAQTGPFGSQLHSDEYVDNGIPVINPSNIISGDLIPDPFVTVDEETARRLSRHALASGDLIFARRGELGRAAVVRDEAIGWLCGTGSLRVRTRSSVLDIRFASYVLQSLATRAYFELEAVGSTMGNLNTAIVLSLPIPLPVMAVQQRIADLLDAEIARIDALIAKKRRLMGLVSQRFWSSFMYLSAIQKAEMVPLRRALVSIADGPFGSAFASADYTTGGAKVVRLGNIGFAEYRFEDQAHIPMDLYARFLRHGVSKGNLLIAGLGDDSNHPGRACVAPELGPAIVKGKSFCAQVNASRASAQYLAYFLSSPSGSDAVGAAARGSTRSMINLEIIKSTLIPLPDLAAQELAVTIADQKRKQVRRAIEALERQIELLAEHRQALITAAVTGELEVSGQPSVDA